MTSVASTKDNGLHEMANEVQRSHISKDKDVIISAQTSAFSDAVTPAPKRVRLSDESNQGDGRLTKTNHWITPAPKTRAAEPLAQKDIQSLLWNEAGYNSTDSSVVHKRSDYLSWDDYFMAVAGLSVLRSKDPIRPTGACIVDPNSRIIGIGYNGFPAGCSDDCLPWSNRTGDPWLHTQTPYMVHAEVNAILNKCAPSCDGARLYTKHFPCNECAKVIVQSGIAEVVYVESPQDEPKTREEDDRLRASRILFAMAGVKLRPYHPVQRVISLDFTKVQNEQTLTPTDQDETSPPPSSQAVSEDALKHQELLESEASYDPVAAGPTKRSDVLSWDDYFMAIACLTAQRSKDPNTQVGACIVDANKRIIGLGYNGFPVGCSDDHLPWARKASSALHTKYLYVCHAEVNAILNKGSADVRGASLYVALFPCNDCAKMIIQAGIREVVFMSDHYHDTDGCRASRILLTMAGVRLRKHVPLKTCLSVHLDSDEDLTKKS